MAIKKILGSSLIFVILVASVYYLFPDNIRIDIEKTRTKYSVWNEESEKYELAATEYLKLYDGSTKMRAKDRELINWEDDKYTYTQRISIWKDNITTKQTYKFLKENTDIEKVPIDNSLDCINCEDKIVHYEIRDITYGGITQEIDNGFKFGKNMQITWQEGAYYSKVFQQKVASDKIIIKYRPTKSEENYKIRLFDPLSINKDTVFKELKENNKHGSAKFQIDNPYESGKLSFEFNEVCGKVESYDLFLEKTCKKNISVPEIDKVESCKDIFDDNISKIVEVCTNEDQIVGYKDEEIEYPCFEKIFDLNKGIEDYAIIANISDEKCPDGTYGHQIDWIPTFQGGSVRLTKSEWAWWNASLTADHHWTLNETSGAYVDIAGSSDGTSNSVTRGQAGVFNSSAYFTGSASYVSTGLSITSGDFSVSAWIKPNTATGYYTIGQIDANYDGWGITMQTDLVVASMGKGSAPFITASHAEAYDSSIWYHVVVIFNDATNNVSIYVNGTEVATAQGDPFDYGADHLAFGRDSAERDNNYWTGWIDDLSIFLGDKLTADDISYLYNGGTGCTYPFDCFVNSAPSFNETPNNITIYYGQTASISDINWTDADGDNCSVSSDIGSVIINNETKIVNFTWTPSSRDSIGVTTVNLTLNDGSDTNDTSFGVEVLDVLNATPSIISIGYDNETTQFFCNFTQPDGDNVSGNWKLHKDGDWYRSEDYLFQYSDDFNNSNHTIDGWKFLSGSGTPTEAGTKITCPGGGCNIYNDINVSTINMSGSWILNWTYRKMNSYSAASRLIIKESSGNGGITFTGQRYDTNDMEYQCSGGCSCSGSVGGAWSNGNIVYTLTYNSTTTIMEMLRGDTSAYASVNISCILGNNITLDIASDDSDDQIDSINITELDDITYYTSGENVSVLNLSKPEVANYTLFCQATNITSYSKWYNISQEIIHENTKPLFNETIPNMTLNLSGEYNFTGNFSDIENDDCFIEANNCSILDVSIDNTSRTYNIFFNPTESDFGIYTCNVTLNDTKLSNTSNNFVINLTYSPDIEIYLNGLNNTRKYEYNSVAEITVRYFDILSGQNLSDEVCLDIIKPGHGTNTSCNSSVLHYNLSTDIQSNEFYNLSTELYLNMTADRFQNISINFLKYTILDTILMKIDGKLDNGQMPKNVRVYVNDTMLYELPGVLNGSLLQIKQFSNNKSAENLTFQRAGSIIRYVNVSYDPIGRVAFNNTIGNFTLSLKGSNSDPISFDYTKNFNNLTEIDVNTCRLQGVWDTFYLGETTNRWANDNWDTSHEVTSESYVRYDERQYGTDSTGGWCQGPEIDYSSPNLYAYDDEIDMSDYHEINIDSRIIIDAHGTYQYYHCPNSQIGGSGSCDMGIKDTTTGVYKSILNTGTKTFFQEYLGGGGQTWDKNYNIKFLKDSNGNFMTYINNTYKSTFNVIADHGYSYYVKCYGYGKGATGYIDFDVRYRAINVSELHIESNSTGGGMKSFGANCSIKSAEIFNTSKNITKIYFNASDITYTNTSIIYQASADNGTNWINLTKEQNNFFSTTSGKILRFRVLLSSTNDSLTPKVNSIDINVNPGYVYNFSIDVGADGTYEYNRSSSINESDVLLNVTLGGPQFNKYLSNCVGQTTCAIPVAFVSQSSGGVEYLLLSGNQTINRIELPVSLVRQLISIQNSTYNQSFEFESEQNGELNISSLNFTYYGLKNYTIYAHYNGFNDTEILQVVWTNFTRVMPYNWTEAIFYIPKSNTSKNITPWKQGPFQPILNLTGSVEYSGMDFGIWINTSHKCINYTFSSDNSKDNGTMWINPLTRNLTRDEEYLAKTTMTGSTVYNNDNCYDEDWSSFGGLSNFGTSLEVIEYTNIPANTSLNATWNLKGLFFGQSDDSVTYYVSCNTSNGNWTMIWNRTTVDMDNALFYVHNISLPSTCLERSNLMIKTYMETCASFYDPNCEDNIDELRYYEGRAIFNNDITYEDIGSVAAQNSTPVWSWADLYNCDPTVNPYLQPVLNVKSCCTGCYQCWN